MNSSLPKMREDFMALLELAVPLDDDLEIESGMICLADIDELCELWDLEVSDEACYLWFKELEVGIVVVDPRKMAGMGTADAEFLLAHELGHLYHLHRCDERNLDEEQEADAFAAGLLGEERVRRKLRDMLDKAVRTKAPKGVVQEYRQRLRHAGGRLR